jgi:hypothetical protein
MSFEVLNLRSIELVWMGHHVAESLFLLCTLHGAQLQHRNFDSYCCFVEAYKASHRRNSKLNVHNCYSNFIFILIVALKTDCLERNNLTCFATHVYSMQLFSSVWSTYATLCKRQNPLEKYMRLRFWDRLSAWPLSWCYFNKNTIMDQKYGWSVIVRAGHIFFKISGPLILADFPRCKISRPKL